MNTFTILILIVSFFVSVSSASSQYVFAEDDSIEFRLAEQKRLAEEIRDNLILPSNNPYGDIAIKPLPDKINSNVSYVEIENFKTNNIKLEQSNLAEITMSRILGFKQIHQETKTDVKKTNVEKTEKQSMDFTNFNQLYFQEHISNMEKIRDDVLFKTFTSALNPYIHDLKTTQDSDQIVKYSIEYNVEKTESETFDNALLEQSNLAEITMSRILGFKQINNSNFESGGDVDEKLIEYDEEFKKSKVRTDKSFELDKLKQIELSETLRDNIFETYYASSNPYLEFGTNLDVVTKIVQTITSENPDIYNRSDPIFELKKLLESDRAEELRLKLTGKIYDETFEDDYFEITDD